MKVAVVHEWLDTYAGSERVLEEILALYPQADLFTIVDFIGPEGRAFIGSRTVTTSFIQKLPFSRKKFRNYLPLMPLAVEQFDLSSYDLIISSSHAVAKGVITGPDQMHISYVHTPIRYAWDLQHQYLKETGNDRGVKGWVTRWLLHRIRMWDSRTANGVDHFIANSGYISNRIQKVYRRESEVIYPPVQVEKFEVHYEKEDFYLTASRMVPYKKITLIVEAFNRMKDKKLVVIGQGPEYKKIAAIAGSNIELLGHQPFDVLKSYMQRAKAFVFAAEEDFGIIPVEAQACGTPIIAFGKGGSLETVRSYPEVHPTGLFFWNQTQDDIIEAVKWFESHQDEFLPIHCRSNAEQFSTERFRSKFQKFVNRQLNSRSRFAMEDYDVVATARR
ncbi:glycosyltransferase family 4 protein [Cohnella sp. AR92]|uniref:glycosyltransferase family 4 protein n=1 Tax=Cohnella sp. AR92 TaxID=648716 RepID=UPI000F8E76F0|nr:glycosyltransferase family 4 protein [Cohnella sp. AR92]RUS45288.1 glycosyltransferase family 4 protein [Cohnella sp. AR92]